MSDVVLMVGGLVSALGVGFAIGRSIKAIRQFFDAI